MCPKHVEQFIDSKLVKSTRLSERLALWQKYAKNPINVESVRMEFFRKVRSGKLFQNSRTLKAQKPENLRMNVPDFVKKSYQNPSSGFPIEKSAEIFQNTKKRPRNLNEEEEEWIKNLVALQSCIAGEKIKEPKEPKSKVKKAKIAKRDTKFQQNNDESTDSEAELDVDISDEISVEAQEEISKYLAKKGDKFGTLKSTKIRDFLAAKKLNDIFNKDPPKNLNLKARACLIPLDLKKRNSCPVVFRTFKIGQGSSVDLNLKEYGHCNFASDFHASIFFDQYSRIFELMNYSEHGTVVDNVIFSGDTSLHPMTSKMDQKLRKMARNAFKEEEESQTCFCSKSPANLNYERGCEVSAVLHHGSYVRFGCLQFVFSILTYGNEDELSTEVSFDTKAVKKESKNEENGDVDMKDDV